MFYTHKWATRIAVSQIYKHVVPKARNAIGLLPVIAIMNVQ